MGYVPLLASWANLLRTGDREWVAVNVSVSEGFERVDAQCTKVVGACHKVDIGQGGV